MSYDTIIIGAGLSGLAAGIRLAYFDKQVCVLERHTTIGGLNSFYRLRDRNYDVGLHAVTNYAPPGTKTGPLSKLLRQLRLRWEDFNLSPQIESSIVFPDCTLRFTNDFEFFRQQVAEHFPKQIENFNRLVRHIKAHDSLNLNNQRECSARSILAEFISDPLLIEMILCPLMFYGSPTPHDMDFTQFVIMFNSIFCEGFGRPFQGVRLILKSLVRKFKSLSGELILRSGVREICTEHNRAIGVVLDDGRRLEARNILSSAGSSETFRLCSRVSPQNRDFPPGEISFVETVSILDRHPADLPHKETIVFYNDSPLFGYEPPRAPVDIRSGIICSPNNFHYDKTAPRGLHSDHRIGQPRLLAEPARRKIRRREKNEASRALSLRRCGLCPTFVRTWSIPMSSRHGQSANSPVTLTAVSTALPKRDATAEPISKTCSCAEPIRVFWGLWGLCFPESPLRTCICSNNGELAGLTRFSARRAIYSARPQIAGGRGSCRVAALVIFTAQRELRPPKNCNSGVGKGSGPLEDKRSSGGLKFICVTSFGFTKGQTPFPTPSRNPC